MSSLPLPTDPGTPTRGTDMDWSLIAALPVDEWEKGVNPGEIRTFIENVAEARWVDGDCHSIDQRCKITVLRLLRVVAKRCVDNEERFLRENEVLRNVIQAVCEADEASRHRVVHLLKDFGLFQVAAKLGGSPPGDSGVYPSDSTDFFEEHRTTSIRGVRERRSQEIGRLKQEIQHLRRVAQFREDDKVNILKDNAKIQLEFKHLVTKHKRTIDKYNSLKEMLREARRAEAKRGHDDVSELQRLRQKVRDLQSENHSLIEQRNRAEELCEQREAEALRDMTELQRIHHKVVDRERHRVRELTNELCNVKDDIDNRTQKAENGRDSASPCVPGDDKSLCYLGSQLSNLDDAFRTRAVQSDDVVEQPLLSSGKLLNSTGVKVIHSGVCVQDQSTQTLVASLQRSQQENDRLAAELQQMELRCEAREAEIERICRVVRDYERGNDGLRRLRGELDDTTRAIELLQEENSQLRERLNATTDSLTFSSALQELCIRVGVTQEEIKGLRLKTTAPFSEMETLQAEVVTLKEEVEWLERERRHWMDKVRLQPLLDTKLRLELGLSPEQLKRLDEIVDKMKVGEIVAEEGTDESYKEKYLRQLRLRRKEMEHFSDVVKQQIEKALHEFFRSSDLSSPSEVTRAMQYLRDRIDVLAVEKVTVEDDGGAVDVSQLQRQLQSAVQLLEQSELTIKDNAAMQTALREQLAAATAERDMLLDERDKYRAAIFGDLVAIETLGSERQATIPDGAALGPDCSPSVPLSGHPGVGPAVGASSINFIKHTFEGQLRTKDELIISLRRAVDDMKTQLDKRCAVEAEIRQKLAEACSQKEDIQNQVSALQETNKELTEQLAEHTKVLRDMEGAMQRMDSVNTRELLQKVVLLRKREAKLLQRLRHAMEMHEEASRSAQSMREYINTTFKSLKEALENTSTGFVLPRSSSGVCVEKDILEEMQQRLGDMLRGRFFREDSAYLLQLQRVYNNMEHTEELNVLRLEVRNQKADIAAMEEKLEEQRVELEGLRRLRDAAGGSGTVENHHPVGTWGTSSATRWESEATTWQQKCNLYMKRCEDREREISVVEAQLGEARRELASLHEHIDNSIGGRPFPGVHGDLAVRNTSREQQNDVQEGQEAEQQKPTFGQGQELGGKLSQGNTIFQLEREVARLKSINLGVLHYSLDLQGECKRLEIELEASKQELSIVRDAGDSQRLCDFVSAAIRQHSVLRCQNELALLQVKRTRMQLHATEANLRVAVNEATTYKLNAFRLYRKYVDQTVAVMDYLRSGQRRVDGALSPHRVEILHRRLEDTVADNERCHSIRVELAAQLAESRGTVALLQQQLELVRVENDERHVDALHTKLLSSLSAVRERDVRIVGLQEDCMHLQQKLKRTDAHVQRLMEEISRLEVYTPTVATADGDILSNLLQLKESVFTKAESPAVVIQQDDAGQRRQPEGEVAVRECQRVLEKQVELTRDCEHLKNQLKDETNKVRKLASKNDALKEEVQCLRDRLQQAQRQLCDERQRAEERERRVIRCHEAQVEVARRAADHHNKCLQDMLKSKEGCIKQLQEQLQAERRKYLECQVEESTRMERLHERLFKENSAMVERFREAISGAAEQYEYDVQSAAAGEAPDGASQQLDTLTREVLRLKAELRRSRATNIILESRLTERAADVQRHSFTVHEGTTNAEEQQADYVGRVSSPVGAPAADIIDDQGIVIVSLRQRELALTDELQRVVTERDLLSQQLHEARNLAVEQGGVLQSVAAAQAMKPGAAEVELRAQISSLEVQLAEARAELSNERQEARKLKTDTDQWREQLDSLRDEIVKQQGDVERARRLVVMNEKLNADILHMEQQNEKLILATNLLKQRLIDEARERDTTSRKHQHEMALAQRMGNIQQESSEHLKGVNLRLQSIQRELQEKVRREEETLKKHEEVQRLSYELHLRLQEKEHEISQLRRELVALSSRVSSKDTRVVHERGTQVLSTTGEGQGLTVLPGEDKGRGTLSEESGRGCTKEGSLDASGAAGTRQPHSSLCSSPVRSTTLVGSSCVVDTSEVAVVLRREVEKARRDHLDEISSLRALVDRQARDLEDVNQQLRGERDINQTLRARLHSARRELGGRELRVSQEAVVLCENLEKREGINKKPLKEAKASSTGSSVFAPSLPAAIGSSTQDTDQLQVRSEENVLLKLQVETLKKRLDDLKDAAKQIDFYKKELEEFRRDQVNASDRAQTASPTDVRRDKRTILKLEAVIESLQRELNVDNEVRFRGLEQRITELTTENEHLVAQLNRYQVIPASPAAVSAVNVPKGEASNRQNVLERELLEKNNVILDLRFECESLRLRVSRLQRHLDDVLRADSTVVRGAGVSKQRDRTEALETLVENMRTVVQRLQQENSMLKSKTVSVAKHMSLVRELRELRLRERELREHSEKLSQRLLDSSAGGGAMSGQQARLQRKLQAAELAAERYQVEAQGLKQRVEDLSQQRENNFQLCPESRQEGHDHDYETVDYRSVHPLHALDSDLPPPLPRAPSL